jgi:hypothetical protein
MDGLEIRRERSEKIDGAYVASQDSKRPSVFSVTFPTGDAEESRITCEVLGSEGQEVLASGMISIFVPKKRQ